jgi:starch phosphorylase
MAGKAHPADDAGRALIQKWIQFIRRPEVRPHVIFLSDYDMLLAQHLVQGVDVWINTPRRPWEASGTSGMKVLVNGGLNLSELDGWWAEAYNPKVGWAIGDGQEHGNDPAWDAREAEELYSRLEQEVIPEFYARNDKDLPTDWIGRIRESMAQLTPRFSTNRTVRDYTEEYYLKVAQVYHDRAANHGAGGKQIVDERHALDSKWNALRFGAISIKTSGEKHLFEVQVFFPEIDPEAVRIELYADGLEGNAPVRQEMKRIRAMADATDAYIYCVAVPSARDAADYTVRAIPHYDGVAIPLEDARILWQR